jgi:hypothetical protein
VHSCSCSYTVQAHKDQVVAHILAKVELPRCNMLVWLSSGRDTVTALFSSKLAYLPYFLHTCSDRLHTNKCRLTTCRLTTWVCLCAGVCGSRQAQAC